MKTSVGSLIDRQGIDLVMAPGDAQGIFIKDTASRERFCRSPSPDVAATLGEAVNANVGSAGAQKGLGFELSRGALALGGRDPHVLLARELLYRACELTMNVNADTALSLKIYERFLVSVETIAKAQIGAGSAALAAPATLPALDPGTALPAVAAPVVPATSQ